MRHSFGVIAAALIVGACSAQPSNPDHDRPVSASGVRKANVQVQTDAEGHTVEQQNIAERLKRDNTPGSIKHLYVISAYSGQVLIYSTVKGKVTSSSKRLTPDRVITTGGQYMRDRYGFAVLDGRETDEVLGDDGVYGSSVPYIYWFDTKGVYHQHYIEGGQILHISDQPLNVPRVVLNMETATVAPESR